MLSLDSKDIDGYIQWVVYVENVSRCSRDWEEIDASTKAPTEDFVTVNEWYDQ